LVIFQQKRVVKGVPPFQAGGILAVQEHIHTG
jgi:hypothetical protein